MKARVLVAEDDDGLREMLQLFLQSPAIEVEFAWNGGQALNKYRRAREAGEPYDALVLDNCMPVMSGVEVARAVRHQFGDTAIPIIFHTGNADDLRGLKDLGEFQIMCKPGDTTRLMSAIEAVVGATV